MTPDDALVLVAAALAGAALGAVFFGGLWWGLRRGLASQRPALWLAGSLLLRLAVVLPGFWLVGGGQFGRMLAAMAGFLVARILLLRWLPRGAGPSTEGHRAPQP